MVVNDSPTKETQKRSFLSTAYTPLLKFSLVLKKQVFFQCQCHRRLAFISSLHPYTAPKLPPFRRFERNMATTSVLYRLHHRLQYGVSDATLKIGCYLRPDGSPVVFDIPQSYPPFIFAAELFAAERAITDLAQPNSHFHLFCDNTSVCSALKTRTCTNLFINNRLQQLLCRCDERNVYVEPWWIPSGINPADGPTRGKPPGPWFGCRRDNYSSHDHSDLLYARILK